MEPKVESRIVYILVFQGFGKCRAFAMLLVVCWLPIKLVVATIERTTRHRITWMWCIVDQNDLTVPVWSLADTRPRSESLSVSLSEVVVPRTLEWVKHRTIISSLLAIAKCARIPLLLGIWQSRDHAIWSGLWEVGPNPWPIQSLTLKSFMESLCPGFLEGKAKQYTNSTFSRYT